MSYKETIFLLIFLLGCLTFQSVNSTVTCSDLGNTLSCLVETTNTTLIQETIESKIVSSHITLKITIEGAGAGATLNIGFPENIIRLEVYNSVDTPVFIETSTVNSGMIYISFFGQTVSIMQRDFFIYFPNLNSFGSAKLGMKFLPFFSENKNIYSIFVWNSVLEDVSNRAIDYKMVGNLTKLVYFFWENSEINEIEPGAFKGSNNLKYLSLRNNKIHELKSCTFEGLENTTNIYLSGNNISSVHPYAFIGLRKVDYLFLSNNPNMQLTPIIRMKELFYLDLSGNNPENISPEIIQQLPKLSVLIMSYINFNCTCDTQWISKLSDFGISLQLTGSTCIGEVSRQASNSTLYANCEYSSFQCFNKSIECVGENWTRVDTVDGCECIYSVELYTVSEICSDVDECEDSSICQGNCINTIGSYKCDCLEGFYNLNDTLCSDIDECIVDNGNCTHNCTNSLGSYECSCLPGYQISGFSGCEDINECSLNNGNCSHNCTNTVGSYECFCLPGFLKLGFTECSLTDECNSNNGGCHQNCTNSIDGYVCSCFEGFKVSSLNSSHCDKDPNPGTGVQIANTNGFNIYALFLLAFLLVITFLLPFVLIILVLLFFKMSNSLLASTPASNVFALKEFTLDKNETFDSPSHSLIK